MSIEIDFEMHVDSKGYRLDHGRIIGNGGATTMKRLKALPRPLYQELLKVETPEELRDFANRYGRLTQNRVQDKKVIKGDDVSEILGNIGTMRDFLKILKEARVQPGNLPRWKGPFEYEVDTPEMKFKISGGIPLPAMVTGKLGAWLVPNAAGELEFQLHPPSLLDALWLQFGQALVSKAELRSCEQCGRWFQAGAGGVRIDAKFCSTECRRKFNSLKRSR
jgi:hypothetical protein